MSLQDDKAKYLLNKLAKLNQQIQEHLGTIALLAVVGNHDSAQYRATKIQVTKLIQEAANLQQNILNL